MDSFLMHSYAYLRMCVHPAMAADRVKLRTSHVGKLLEFAKTAANIGVVFIIAFVALIAIAKFVGAATLASLYCDLCTVLPVMLVVP